MKNPDSLPSERSRLLRAAADDELLAGERAALDAHLARRPDDRAVIEFERKLRDGLAHSFSGSQVPAALEQRIRALGAPPRHRLLRRIAWLAAAAALLVAAGITYHSATRADEIGFYGRATLVRFLATHPHDCPISIERTLAEFNVEAYDDALSSLGNLLGDAPALGDLTDAGFEFRGMGRCGIPGHELSIHIQLVGAAGSTFEGDKLSIYVQRDDGRLPITDGATYRLQPKTLRFADVGMYLWRREGFDYFVVSENPEAAIIALRRAGAPAELLML